MNAGKSTSLLQSSYNYRERGMRTLVLTAGIDDRYGVGKVSSRIGLESEASIFNSDSDLIELIKTEVESKSIHCILVDGSQFWSKKQVR